MNWSDRADLVEPKVCEGWDCGVTFYRRSSGNVKSGEKLCERCREKEAVRTVEKRGNCSEAYREIDLRKAS